MKKLLLILGGIILLLAALSVVVSPVVTKAAQAALTTFQGGTGSTSPSGLLYGDSTIRLKTVTIGSNLTFSGGTLSATGGSGTFSFTPTTNYGALTNATGTPLWFQAGLQASSTSYFNNTNSVNATTSSQYVSGQTWLTGLSGGNLQVGSAGLVYSKATSTPSVTAPIAYSGTLGDFIGGVSGAFSCIVATRSVAGCLSSTDFTTFDNKISSTSLSGASVISYTSGTGVITTTGGTFGAGNYVFPTDLTITGNSTSSIGAFTTRASTTQLVISGISSCSGSNALTTNSSGLVACGAISGGGGTFAWTPTTYSGVAVNATSTGLWLKATSPFSLIASSTFANNASSTQLTTTGNTYLATAGGSVYMGGTSGSSPNDKQFIFDPAVSNGFMGIWSSGNNRAYGIESALPCQNLSTGQSVSCLGGYYYGVGVGGGIASGLNPIFGVLNSTDSGNGIGSVAFTVYADHSIRDFYNVIDDGAGKMGIGSSTPYSLLSVNAPAGIVPFSVGSSTGTVLQVNKDGSLQVGILNSQIAMPTNGFLSVGTTTSTRGGADIAWFSRNDNSDAEIAVNNATPGKGAYMVAIGNSNFVSFEQVGSGGADWKEGMFGSTAFSIADNGTNVFNIEKGAPANSLYVKTTSGNVGIGSSTPWKQLSVGSTNAGTFAIATSTAGCASFSSGGELYSTGTACGTGGGGTYSFFPFSTYATTTTATTSPLFSAGGFFASTTSAIPSLAITQSGTGPAATFMGGNIGVGTTTPATLLEVQGDVSGGVARFTRTNATTNAVVGVIKIRAQSSGQMVNGFGGAFQFYNQDADGVENTVADIRGIRDGADNNGALTFSTAQSGTVYEGFRLTNNSYIGVGSTSPYAKVSIHQGPLDVINTTLFDIGSSTATATTTLFTVKNTGKTGIGTSTPYGLLSLNAPAGTDPYFVIGSTTGEVAKITAAATPQFGLGTSTPFGSLTVEQGTETASVWVANQGSTTPSFAVMGVNGSGYVGIGTSTPWVPLGVQGRVALNGLTTSGSAQTGYICYAAGGELIQDSAVCIVSAKKFKKDIQGLSVGLKDLMQLTPVSYYKKDPLGPEDAKKQMGFIADDIPDSLKEMLVTYDTNGDVHGFRYEQLTSLIVKSIQEQQKEIENIKGTATNNWQWGAIALLVLWNLYLTFRRKRL